MIEESDLHAKAFILLTTIILLVNLSVCIYGKNVDMRVEKAKETLRSAYDVEYDDDISKLVAELEMSSKELRFGLSAFISKNIAGIISVILLVLPGKLYKMFEFEYFNYLIPNRKYEFVIMGLLVVMSLWNIVSPFGEISDYLNVYRGVVENLDFFDTKEFINSLSAF